MTIARLADSSGAIKRSGMDGLTAGNRPALFDSQVAELVDAAIVMDSNHILA